MILIIVNGLFTILKELKIGQVIIGKQFEINENLKEFLQIVNEKKIKVIVAEVNSKIYIEKNLFFNILWPDNNKIIKDNAINNNALVCKMCYKNISMLFTGDIEEKAENILVEKYKNSNVLNADILKVGHHGSKTSSTEKFLKLIKPEIALIGVGENNIFGHPNLEVIERLKKLRYKNI